MLVELFLEKTNKPLYVLTPQILVVIFFFPLLGKNVKKGYEDGYEANFRPQRNELLVVIQAISWPWLMPSLR